VVLVNVHGGGMQPCDTIADGIGMAMRQSNRTVPMVARLAGNNADFARMRLANYGVAYTEGADMWDAVTRAVRLTRPEAA
jgi:succinyl-CoA synthetase beta subunit